MQAIWGVYVALMGEQGWQLLASETWRSAAGVAQTW